MKALLNTNNPWEGVIGTMKNKIAKTHVAHVAILAVLFFSNMPALLWGQDNFTEPYASNPEAAAGNPAGAAAPAGAKVEKMPDGKFYLDFKDSSLINVLNVIASLSGINFIAGKEVADRMVNMTLDGVSLEDALQAISQGCNVSYDFLPGRNIYLFRAGSDAPDKAVLTTKVFKLYYIRVNKLKEIEANSSGSGNSAGGGLVTLKAEDATTDLGAAAIVKAVEKILSDRGKVSVDDRSNSLVVTDSEDRLRMVETAITALDQPLDQVLINVLLVETFEDLDRALGVTWGDANGVFGTLSGASQDTTWPFFATPVNDGGNSFWKTSYDMFKNTAKQFNPAHSSDATAAAGGVRDFSNFQVTVTALESASKLQILAKPKILVLDNHPAIVKISTNAAIGKTVTTASAGGSAGTSTSTAERAEIGTILRVTPLIDAGDRITMTVEPTFATVDESAISIGSATDGATGDPTVRTARTTLMVNDGQTIALGGLLISNQSNGNRKVPFFGNLPLIGKALFTNNSKALQDRELILFVTPYIIRDPSVLETPNVPDKRLRYDDETAPFWKVKQKEWYKRMDERQRPTVDYEKYFDVRKKLMDATLDTLDQKASQKSEAKK